MPLPRRRRWQDAALSMDGLALMLTLLPLLIAILADMRHAWSRINLAHGDDK